MGNFVTQDIFIPRDGKQVAKTVSTKINKVESMRKLLPPQGKTNLLKPKPYAVRPFALSFPP
ncbi:hypothetical protein SDC9_206228 [bioreactor metagenome]|uniref:Uncharacterized protein n=1 Tax=bioreactor metagenome TaxID=1076179 RepID=A0A645JFZ7_9ZZZZ